MEQMEAGEARVLFFPVFWILAAIVHGAFCTFQLAFLFIIKAARLIFHAQEIKEHSWGLNGWRGRQKKATGKEQATERWKR